MKRNNIIWCVVFILSAAPLLLCAQDTDAPKTSKNVLKVNLLSIPFNNIHLQYERQIAKKISVALGVRYMPEGDIPQKSKIIDLIDDQEVTKHISNFKTGNYAITPEIRFYMGKAALKGFYIAPFARYSNYTASLPFEFEYDVSGVPNKETIPLEGTLTTFTGGVMLGSQFRLAKMVTLDWWILGPQYGASKGDILGKKNLTPEEQDGLREELEGFTEDLPLVKTSYTVDGNGARLNLKGPWAGIRAGLCLGIRF